MKALLSLINDTRACIAALHNSNIDGFKKGQHLARLTARLHKLYRRLATVYVLSDKSLTSLLGKSSIEWLIHDTTAELIAGSRDAAHVARHALLRAANK